jgi:hypothetical protein
MKIEISPLSPKLSFQLRETRLEAHKLEMLDLLADALNRCEDILTEKEWLRAARRLVRKIQRLLDKEKIERTQRR